ncbi:GreA/GreB family elongation factor, partial [Roseateles saccharophilus]
NRPRRANTERRFEDSGCHGTTPRSDQPAPILPTRFSREANKYDTLGLEAAYLATGQARRAEAIRQAIANWRQFRPGSYDAGKGIQLGALVCLVDADDKQQQLFLGPGGGSMTLVSGAQIVQVISSEAPLGKALLGKCEGDAVSIEVAPVRRQFEVLRVN